ncbi:putative carbohydrate-binding module family 20 protein [Blattamonas nauphoetae]|uniref:Carbohydrate-binding module family 20 protein n=1 Tax=Blattamonas nauphoetae TaxID=2049346 RepID=A0ABQ9XAI3_9EUKA|nr:putative carbohydrate-binding module family 20 protein [Blattamonas nauphoetae]
MSNSVRSHKFSLRFASKWGQNCYVVGEVKELGHWNPGHQLRMVYTEDSLWTITLDVPTTFFRYSYVIIDDFDPNRGVTWEPRTDRELKPDQLPRIDDWGVGKKVQMMTIPNLEKPFWRCPMPYSRMFDASNEIHKELEDIGINVIALLTHLDEANYHTNGLLLPYYAEHKMNVHMFSIDDKSVPWDIQSFRKYVRSVIELIKKDGKVCIHCHSGTGRTGVLVASHWTECSRYSCRIQWTLPWRVNDT